MAEVINKPGCYNIDFIVSLRHLQGLQKCRWVLRKICKKFSNLQW